MAGTREGGLKASVVIREKYGLDYWQKIGKEGGLKKVKKGFAMMTPEKRREAGMKGGRMRHSGAKKRLLGWFAG